MHFDSCFTSIKLNETVKECTALYTYVVQKWQVAGSALTLHSSLYKSLHYYYIDLNGEHFLAQYVSVEWLVVYELLVLVLYLASNQSTLLLSCTKFEVI